MPKTSHETTQIRRLIERLSEDDLFTKGPKDLKVAIEKAGLSYDAVRDNVSNELARARRKKGIRKGQGRRKAARPSTADEGLERQLRLFSDFELFREKHFESWAECREVVAQLLRFRDQFGSDKNMLLAIEIKLGNEESS